MTPPLLLPSRLLAGFGTLALLAGLGLIASRPAHTAGGPIAVSVANTPIATISADSPDQQPFQYTLAPHSSVSSTASDSYTVPAGKRVVIEYYSARILEYPVGGYSSLFLITTANGKTASYEVVPTSSSFSPTNQITRIYADPGTQITAYVGASSGTGVEGNMILSGHYVDVK